MMKKRAERLAFFSVIAKGEEKVAIPPFLGASSLSKQSFLPGLSLSDDLAAQYH